MIAAMVWNAAVIASLPPTVRRVDGVMREA